MLEKLELRDVGPAPHMTVQFAPRLNILTGDNGLGKTFLLDVAWWALTRTWAGEPAWPKPGQRLKPVISYHVTSKHGKTKPVEIAYRFSEQRWPLPRRHPAVSELVLYARIDGGFSVWDPARNNWKEALQLNIQQPPAYHFSAGSLWNGLESIDAQTGKPQILCNGLIRDWVHWQLENAEAFSQLKTILSALSPGEAEPLRPAKPGRVKISDVRDIPFLETPYGSIPILHVSAGAKRILGLAYLLVWAWQEHVNAARFINRLTADRVILLVDELEAHLHPQWQRLILPALLAVIKKLQADVEIQVIAVSHAPLVLASVEPIFDEEQDKVIHFKLEQNQVAVEDIPWAKQGDVVNWLVSDVFGLRQGRSAPAERAIEAAEAFMRGDIHEVPEELRSEELLHRELVRVLAGNDEFWPRWILEGPGGSRFRRLG